MHHKLLKLPTKIILSPFFGKIRGGENIPKDCGVIMAANHASYLDHFLIGYVVVDNTGKEGDKWGR